MKTEYRRVVEAEARETEVRERAELETKKAREEELLRLNRALRGV